MFKRFSLLPLECKALLFRHFRFQNHVSRITAITAVSLLGTGLLQPEKVRAQQKPSIVYSQGSYTFSKGAAGVGVPAPSNSGGSIPSTVRGAVEESIGIGEYTASRITKSGDGNLISSIYPERKLQLVNLSSKKVTHTLSNRDRPSGMVTDSKGVVYWAECGRYEVIANPDAKDAASYASGFLDLASAVAPGKTGDILSIISSANDLVGDFNGGNDLIRTISGTEEPPPYILRFSGKIWKLMPGSTTPEVFVENVQVPTGLAIDKDDNLYVSCFTANFEVKGGPVLSGENIEVVDDVTGSYDSRILKITPGKVVTTVCNLTGIDYPTHLGIDDQGNFSVMYAHGVNKDFVGVARVNKYPDGQTSGATYQNITVLLNGGTIPAQNLPVFQDLAMDGFGNIYLSDFFADRILMLPPDGKSNSYLQVFAENIFMPIALYIDRSKNQLWVKEGRMANSGGIKKLSLYGYGISPNLPQGLILNSNGSITGTPTGLYLGRPFTVTASNLYGVGTATFDLDVRQLRAPQIKYTPAALNLTVSKEITIPAPSNTGGAVNQQIGPITTQTVYSGKTGMKGVEFDNEGNRYFVQPDSGRIMKVDPAGKASVYISGLNSPTDIAINKNNGTFYFSEIGGGNSVSAKYPGFDKATGLISGATSSIVIDESGNLYFAAQGNGLIHKYYTNTGQLSTFAEGLNQPCSIALYNGYLYVLNIYGLLQKMPLSNPSSKTTIADLKYGSELAIDEAGNIFVATYTSLYKIPAGSTTPQIYKLPLSFTPLRTNGIIFDHANNMYVSVGKNSLASYDLIKITEGGFSISPALPEGLTFNGDGTITGTPITPAAAKTFTVTASNAIGEGVANFSIAVLNLATSDIKYSVPARYFRGVDIATVAPVVTGGKPDSFSVSPALPSGLTLNASTGEISGRASVLVADETYNITANNPMGSATTSVKFLVTELPPSSLQYQLANFSLQKDITISLNQETKGGTTGLNYVISPALPDGLTFDASTGRISGKPTAVTTEKEYTVTASNVGGSTQTRFRLLVRIDPPSNLNYNFPTKVLMNGIAMRSVAPTVSGSGVTGYSIAPSLPSGLIFNSLTGMISGIPTQETDEILYTVTATNDAGSGSTTFPLSTTNSGVPDISYASTSFTFTKGIPITPIPAPQSTGGAFPQQRVGETSYTGLKKSSGVATDRSGNAYVADFEGGVPKIKKLVKGATQLTDFVSSGLGSTEIFDLAVDASGNIYASAELVIKKITPAGTISDFSTNRGRIRGLFIDQNNDLYVAENDNGNIVKYENCNAAARTILMSGLSTPVTGTLPGGHPQDVVVDKQKNIYVLNSGYVSGNAYIRTFIHKYLAADNYNKNNNIRLLESHVTSNYMALDVYENLYFNTAVSTIGILNNYTDGASYMLSPMAAGITGIAIDADQNVFYGSMNTDQGFAKFNRFGYNTTGLPKGLVLNGDGTISGTPEELKTQTDYKVTASLFYGSSTDTLHLTVIDQVPDFQYTQPDQVLTAGVAYTGNLPASRGGAVVSYAVSPAQLPAGITFNTTTGAFSGTATTLQDKPITYTVTGTNTGGTATTNVSFMVIDKAPVNLVYPADYTLIVNKQFKGAVPTLSGGAITKWSISPDLPEGLSLDTLSGLIQGVAIASSPAGAYTLKAENTGGHIMATVNIRVDELPPNIAYNIQDKFKFKKGEAISTIDAPANSGGPIASYQISGLPAGLRLNTNGTISGTPTQTGKSTAYTIIADGGQWGRDTTSLSIEIVSLPPDSISYGSPITIVKGKAITAVAPAYKTSGGDPVERFIITPELPDGLSLNPTTGVISGAATGILTSNGQLYYVTAENGAGSNSTPVLFVIKDVPPAISYQQENTYTKGTAVSLTVNSTGGAITKYTITPALPEGLSLDSLTGEISGNPSVLNPKKQYTVTAINYGNPDAVVSFYITIVDEKPVISYPTAHKFTRTVEISPINVNATGGTVLEYTVNPGLPKGLTLDSLSGTIKGIPAVSQTARDFIVTATNTGGSDTAVVNISVKNAAPAIAYNALNKFTILDTVNIEPVSTGGDQITFSISPNSLPAGLGFNTETGAIRGIPTDTTALKDYTVTAVNDGGTSTAGFSIKVNDKAPAELSYAELTDEFYVGYAIDPLTPIVKAGGGAIVRFAIVPSNIPPGLSFNTNTGTLSGTPTSDFVRTSYTVTAYNSGGTSQTSITFAVIKLSATVTKTDVLCNGSSTGTAEVTVTGGKAPYRYSWSPTGGTAAKATGLSARTYTVTITDANNTTITRSITIEEPSALAIGNFLKTDNSLNGGAEGTATATVSGGVAPYTYAWSSNASTTETASGLQEGTYTLTVTDANGCSVSKSVFIDAPPAAPAELTAKAGNAKNTLTWQAGTEEDLTTYKVYGGTSANPTALLQILSAPIVTYTHENLSNGTPYYYRVTAVDKAGYESAKSEEVTATPQGTQSIAFTALSAKTYGDADFSAGATASSGLNITYTSDNPDVATIVAGKVHIKGAGTANISAAQEGNSAWLPAATQTQELTVSKRALSVSAHAEDKVYDGNRTAMVSLINNKLTGDELILEYQTALFNNKNAGTGKTVSISGITISGKDAPNYTYPATVSATADITIRPLTVQASAEDKVYDGNTAARAALSDDRVNGDLLEVAFTSADFNTKNTGSAKPVSIKGISINGADAANYSIKASTAATTASITGKTLTVSATGHHKVYDGNTTATVSLADNRISGDIITANYDSAVFDDKNVGDQKTITVTGITISGADAANYLHNSDAVTTGNITARKLLVTAEGTDKVYDGNLTAIVSLTDNRVKEDELTPSYAFAIFDDKNIGSDKGVAVFGLKLSGKDAGNYSVDATVNTTASITAKQLTITAEDKTKIQGMPLPQFTVKYEGFVNGESNNILTTPVSLTTTATDKSPQGDYPIVAASATAQNYSITFIEGILNVKPGTPTSIGFNQALLLENSPAATLTATLSSISPDPEAVFTYTLASGAGDADNAQFSISGNQLLSAAVFDYETQSSFNIRLRTTTQYGTFFEQAFVVQLTDVNEIPTLADIASQTICYTAAQQSVPLSEITAGPESSQTTSISVSSDNTTLFSSLSAGNVRNRAAQLSYRIAPGQSGVANITVTVTDNGGTANGGVNVITKVFRITVNPLPEIGISSTLGTDFSKGETTTLVATGGVGYQWSGPAGMIGDRNSNTLKVRPETAVGTYTVTVISKEGCESTQSITLNTKEDIAQIAGTNILTPNGDGVNDNLIIKNVELYPNNELEVFDRAGRKIYSAVGYHNEWDGMLNGAPLAEGTYYYIINFKNVGRYKGFITIIKNK